MPQELRQLRDNIWYRPSHPDPNRVEPAIGVIVGNDATILIDAGNSPQQAAAVITAVNAIGAPPIRHILYTHHHWDHTFGAFVYDVPVIGHTRCRQAMLAMLAEPWSSAYLRRRIERNPDLELSWTAVDWNNFRLIPPETTFPGSSAFTLAGIRFEMELVGGAHAADSTVIKLPDAGVAFLGDCYYPAPIYAGGDINGPIDAAMLSRIVDDAIDIYVDGHKPPYTKRQLQRIARSHGLISNFKTT